MRPHIGHGLFLRYADVIGFGQPNAEAAFIKVKINCAREPEQTVAVIDLWI